MPTEYIKMYFSVLTEFGFPLPPTTFVNFKPFFFVLQAGKQPYA
jgi:hypothetical protein